jgi:hypothetical protein
MAQREKSPSTFSYELMDLWVSHQALTCIGKLGIIPIKTNSYLYLTHVTQGAELRPRKAPCALRRRRIAFSQFHPETENAKKSCKSC